MELSGALPASRGLVQASLGGGLLGVARGALVEILSLETMEALHGAELPSPATCLSWGLVCGAPALAAGCAGAGSIVVLCGASGAIIADVYAGAGGLAGLSLSRAGLLLAFAECGLGATAVDVPRGSVKGFLPGAKTGGGGIPARRAAAWARGGRFAAVAVQGAGGDDAAVLLDSGAGAVAMRAPAGAALGGVADIGGVAWAGPALLVWGAPLDPAGNAALALLAPDGQVLHAGAPAPLHAGAAPPDAGLGVRVVSVARGGRLAAVGGWDGVLRVVVPETWAEAAAFDLAAPKFDPGAPPAVFREVPPAHRRLAPSFELVGSLADARIAVAGAQARELKQGVALAEFSGCSQFLAAVADSSRNVLLVWHVPRLRLAAVLVLQDDVVHFKWATAPDGPACVVVTGSDHVYVWKEAGAAAVRVEDSGRGGAAGKRAFAKVVVAEGKHAAVVVDGAGHPGCSFVGVYFV